MTPAEYRSLDAEVAVKVMGWNHVGRLPLNSVEYAGEEFEDTLQGCWYKDHVHVAHGRERWAPSTDIQAAWEVVEKLVADGGGVQVHGYNGAWYVSSDRVKTYGTERRFIESSAPLAICRMALATVAR